MSEKELIRGNGRLDRMLQRPGTAEAVARLEQQADALDRVHAMSLAMVREAGKHTQAEIARTLNMKGGTFTTAPHDGRAGALRWGSQLANFSATSILFTARRTSSLCRMPLLASSCLKASNSSGEMTPRTTGDGP